MPTSDPRTSNRPYSVITLDQGSEAWHHWRSQGLGASDAPTIMGENPWKTRDDLLHEKIHNIRTPGNAAMARGVALEPEARRSYELRAGRKFHPVCLQSTSPEWLLASVDGLADDHSRVVEIKCGESVYRRASTTKRVPDYYVGQLQHILAVTGLPEIDFWCYLPDLPEVHLRMARDERYIEKMLVEEERFWGDVCGGRGR
jgi:putative phage-type endonuclease